METSSSDPGQPLSPALLPDDRRHSPVPELFKSRLQNLRDITEDDFFTSSSRSHRTSLWVGGNQEAQERRHKLRALDMARLVRKSIANPETRATSNHEARRSSAPDVFNARLPVAQRRKSAFQMTTAARSRIPSAMIQRVSMSRADAAFQPLSIQINSPQVQMPEYPWPISTDQSPPSFPRPLSPLISAAPKIFPGNPDVFFAPPGLRSHTITSVGSISPTSTLASRSPRSSISEIYPDLMERKGQTISTIPSPGLSPRQLASPSQIPSLKPATRSHSPNDLAWAWTKPIEGQNKKAASLQMLHSHHTRSASTLLCQQCFSKQQTFSQIKDGLCEECGGDKALDRHYWDSKE